MLTDLPARSIEIKAATHRLCELSLTLAEEGRQAIRSTREKIEHSRQILNGIQPESAEALIDNLRRT